MFKKFKNGEIFINRIKAHPRVEFMLNSGSFYYNKFVEPLASAIPNGSVGINDFPMDIYVPPSEVDNDLLAESGDFIITEGGDYIEVE